MKTERKICGYAAVGLGVLSYESMSNESYHCNGWRKISQMPAKAYIRVKVG